MSELDFDAEFAKLTESLADVPESTVALSLVDLLCFMEILCETNLHMSRFVGTVIANLDVLASEIPAELIPLLPGLARGCEEITKILHELVCDDEDDDDEGEDE